MKYNFWFLLSIFLLLQSCGSNDKTDNSTTTKDSVYAKEAIIQSSIKITLSKTSREAVSDWQEFQEVDNFMLNYYGVTPSDALSLSGELNDLVTFMRDSVRVEKLKVATISSRLNVLQNETMRLNDMSTISSIETEEVTQEVHSILEVYDSFLSRINTIYKAEELQNALEFDTETPIDVKKDPMRKPSVPARKRTSLGTKN